MGCADILNDMLDVHCDEFVKLKTRSLPGLIKQPARSPLLTSSRFKGKAPLSTTCLHIISNHFDMQSSVSMWKSCLCEESIT